jgi:hypothetical protein
LASATPEELEAFAMPTNEGFRCYDGQCASPIEPAAEPHEHQADSKAIVRSIACARAASWASKTPTAAEFWSFGERRLQIDERIKAFDRKLAIRAGISQA